MPQITDYPAFSGEKTDCLSGVSGTGRKSARPLSCGQAHLRESATGDFQALRLCASRRRSLAEAVSTAQVSTIRPRARAEA